MLLIKPAVNILSGNSSLLADKVTIAAPGKRLTCNKASTEKSAKTAGLKV